MDTLLYLSLNLMLRADYQDTTMSPRNAHVDPLLRAYQLFDYHLYLNEMMFKGTLTPIQEKNRERITSDDVLHAIGFFYAGIPAGERKWLACWEEKTRSLQSFLNWFRKCPIPYRRKRSILIETHDQTYKRRMTDRLTGMTASLCCYPCYRHISLILFILLFSKVPRTVPVLVPPPQILLCLTSVWFAYHQPT
jgi:hypothetical protein